MSELTPHQKIEYGRQQIINNNPYFAKFLMHYPIAEDNRVKTAYNCVNRMGYNKDFIASLTPDETQFIVAHEMFHMILKHSDPQFNNIGGVERTNADLINIARDYVINQILVDAKIGTMPEKGCYEPSGIYRNRTWQAVYDHLIENHSQSTLNRMTTLDDHDFDFTEGDSINGEELQQVIDDVRNGIATEELTPQQEESIKELLQAVKNHNESDRKPNIGEFCGMSELLGYMNAIEMDYCKINWKTLLDKYTEPRMERVKTYTRPNKKASKGIILPRKTKSKVRDVLKFVIAFDVSGSISERKAQAFLGRVHNIIDSLEYYELDVLCYNDVVHNHEKYTQDVKFDYKVSQPNGGNRTNRVFEYLREKNITPDLCIVFTDAGEDNWGDPTGCKNTMWAIEPFTDNLWSSVPKPNWGEFVYLPMEH